MEYKLWHDFTQKGILSLEVEENISRSWKTSRIYNVPCEALYKEQELSAFLLEKLLHRHKQHLTFTKEYLNGIAQGFRENIQKADYGIFLLNNEGYLLQTINNFSDKEEKLLGLSVGVNWGVNMKGTTAIGLTLEHNRHEVVKNYQHYQQRYHPYITEAIPIKNPQGDMIYILGLLSSTLQHSKLLSTLGRMTVRAIENEMVAIRYKSEVKELTEKVRKQNKRYETQTNLLNYILDNTREMIFIMNEEGKYILLNKASWKFMKENQVYNLRDIYEKLQVYNLEGKRMTKEEDTSLSIFTGKPIYTCKTMIRNLKGEEAYYHIHAIPYCDDLDRKLAIGIVEDITDYVKLQEVKNSFKSKAEQLEMIINTISDGVAILSPEGEYIMMNPACLKILPCLGRSKKGHYKIYDEVVEEKACSIIDKKSFGVVPCLKIKKQNDDKVYTEMAKEKICNISMIDKKGNVIGVEDYPLLKVLKGKKIKNQVFIINRNRKITYIQLSGSPVFDVDGKVAYAVISVNDITKIKKQEMKIKQQKEFINNVMNAVGAPMAVITYPDYVHKYLNHVYLEIISRIAGKNLTYEDIIGKTIYEILPPAYSRFMKHRKETLISEEITERAKMLSVKTPQGDGQYYQVVYTMLPNGGDGQKQMVVVGMDVTPQVKLQKETERLTKSREEYFATISHELRSPITIIHSVVQMLKSEYYTRHLTDGTKRLVSKVEKNTLRLLRLVNNFLDITRAEAGFMKLTLTNTNLVTYTDFIVESILPIGEKKNIEIDFSYDCSTATIALDVEKYERILLNLLSNAFKFTESNGKIQVYIQEDEEYMKVGVKDSGIGIAQEEVDKIFNRFYIAEHINKGEHRGTGIGLSLVKKLMEFMGGKIEVYSQKGNGSEFILFFPKKLEANSLNTKIDKQQLTENAYLELENIP
ncbi:ATP-binding protein [Clostridium formicaceticum]|uniref:histidine kinase n=1 Tax=Clostridium formicaceticum TaxID=1497 RepID=A0AAC9RJH2_9CLOT|nr:ATP-binding protein [Clostridium formicaceticum]AOY76056.1 hypothetical protein BJL90_09185 [Clostridium formicaceticum]ARE86418.1 Sensor histidine kinase TmoS [Clostridium formicaceticum]